MSKNYFGKITSLVYEAALRIRGDDETCWDEMVPLAEPPLIFGARWPEELSGDEVIEIWELALTEAEQTFGAQNYVLDSVTLFLVDSPHTSNSGEVVWQSNARANS